MSQITRQEMLVRHRGRYAQAGKELKVKIIHELAGCQPTAIPPEYSGCELAVGRAYLLTTPLVAMWIGIGVVYAGLFFCLKKPASRIRFGKSLRGLRDQRIHRRKHDRFRRSKFQLALSRQSRAFTP
jgi:hypothetical protein